MQDNNDNGFKIDKDDFDGVIKKFGSQSTHSYDFLLKGGSKYKEAMFKF